MKFPEKLAMLIGLTGVKSVAIARALGIKPPNVSRMLSGEQKPSLEQGLVIARALGVTLDYLADDDQDEPVPALAEDERAFLDLYRLVRAGKLPEFVDALRDVSEAGRYAGDPTLSHKKPPAQTPTQEHSPGPVPAGGKRTA